MYEKLQVLKDLSTDINIPYVEDNIGLCEYINGYAKNK